MKLNKYPLIRFVVNNDLKTINKEIKKSPDQFVINLFNDIDQRYRHKLRNSAEEFDLKCKILSLFESKYLGNRNRTIDLFLDKLINQKDHVIYRERRWDNLLKIAENSERNGTTFHKQLRELVCNEILSIRGKMSDYAFLQRAFKFSCPVLAKFLILSNLDMFDFDKNNQTPLHHAAILNIPEVIGPLTQQFDKDIPDSNGMTPLMHACNNHSVLAARELIKNGANVNALDKVWCTPLIYLAHSKKNDPLGSSANDLAMLLIEQGANVNHSSVNRLAKTALEGALKTKNELMAMILIEKGATVLNPQGRELTLLDAGEDALSAACENNLENLATMLVREKHINVNYKNFDDQTPLQIALQNGHFSIARLLMEHGADLNEILDVYFYNGHLLQIESLVKSQFMTREEMLRKIQELNADLSIKYDEERSMLMRCCIDKFENTAHILIEAGCDLNEADDFGKTALHYACENNLESVALRLIEKGIHTNVRAIHNNVLPIHSAARNDMQAVIEKLAQLDISLVNEKTTLQDTPLSYSYIRGNTTLARYLVERLCVPLLKSSERFLFSKNLLCQMFSDLTSIVNLIQQQKNWQGIIDVVAANIDDLLDPAKNLPGANPLKIMHLSSDAESLSADVESIVSQIKQRLTPEEFQMHYVNFAESKSERLYDKFFKMNLNHIERSRPIEIPPLSEVAHVDPRELLVLFDEKVPKDSRQPYDDGELSTKENMRQGLEEYVRRLVERVDLSTHDGTTPPKGTPEFDAYYDNYDSAARHNLIKIKTLPDDEQVTHLYSMAREGLHCGGNDASTRKQFRELHSAELPISDAEEVIAGLLQQFRDRIVDGMAAPGDPLYLPHRLKHLWFLLAKGLNLTMANDSSLMQDAYANDLFLWTPEKAESEFYKHYQPKEIIDEVYSYLKNIIRHDGDKNSEQKKEVLFGWIKDNMPSDWQKEKYEAIARKIQKYERLGTMTSIQIRNKIFQKYPDVYMVITEFDPMAAIEKDRRSRYMSLDEPEDSWKEWNSERYNPIIEQVKLLSSLPEEMEPKDLIKKFLQYNGIEIFDHSWELALQKTRESNYLMYQFFVSEDNEEEGFKILDVRRAEVIRMLLRMGVLECSDSIEKL